MPNSFIFPNAPLHSKMWMQYLRPKCSSHILLYHTFWLPFHKVYLDLKSSANADATEIKLPTCAFWKECTCVFGLSPVISVWQTTVKSVRENVEGMIFVFISLVSCFYLTCAWNGDLLIYLLLIPVSQLYLVDRLLLCRIEVLNLCCIKYPYFL